MIAGLKRRGLDKDEHAKQRVYECEVPVGKAARSFKNLAGNRTEVHPAKDRVVERHYPESH